MQWHLILLFEIWPRILSVKIWRSSEKKDNWYNAMANGIGAHLHSHDPYHFHVFPRLMSKCQHLYYFTWALSLPPKLTPWEQPLTLANRSWWMNTLLPRLSGRVTLWHVFGLSRIVSGGGGRRWHWAPAAHSASRPGRTPFNGCLAVSLSLSTALLVLRRHIPKKLYSNPQFRISVWGAPKLRQVPWIILLKTLLNVSMYLCFKCIEHEPMPSTSIFCVKSRHSLSL